MNLGTLMLGLLLICGACVLMFAVAGNTPMQFNDTYNTNAPEITNQTHTTIINGTATTAAFGGGLLFLVAAFIIVVAIVIVVKSGTGSSGNYRTNRR